MAVCYCLRELPYYLFSPFSRCLFSSLRAHARVYVGCVCVCVRTRAHASWELGVRNRSLHLCVLEVAECFPVQFLGIGEQVLGLWQLTFSFFETWHNNFKIIIFESQITFWNYYGRRDLVFWGKEIGRQKANWISYVIYYEHSILIAILNGMITFRVFNTSSGMCLILISML